MCESGYYEPIPDRIRWDGWETTWDNLRAAGWEITRVRAYENWRTPNLDSHERIYIRNSKTRYIGRLTLHADGDPLNTHGFVPGQYCTLDFLTHERNMRIKPNAVYEEQPYTEADIPKLMELVVALQKKFRKKPKPEKPNNVYPLPIVVAAIDCPAIHVEGKQYG